MAEINKWRIRESLAKLIEEARVKKLWLHCYYQDIWMSPDELTAENASDKFLWDTVNWDLRDPAEHLLYLIKKVQDAKQNVAVFRKRMGEHVE